MTYFVDEHFRTASLENRNFPCSVTLQDEEAVRHETIRIPANDIRKIFWVFLELTCMFTIIRLVTTRKFVLYSEKYINKFTHNSRDGTKTTRDRTLPQHKCTDCPSASSIRFHCYNVFSDIIHLIPPYGKRNKLFTTRYNSIKTNETIGK